MESRFWPQKGQMKNKFKIFIIATFFASLTWADVTDELPHIKFEKGKLELLSSNKKIKKIITVEFAKAPEQQQKGLMFRTKLAADEGMLFEFTEERQLAFWMKNTYIPLDIAYIGKNFVIVDIQQMEPASKLLRSEPPSYPSKKPAQYALEMNKGWFKKNKFKVGDSIKILK